MSFAFYIYTHSMDGLPLKTLEKGLKKHGLILVESVGYHHHTKTGRAVYEVSGHESVNSKVEEKGD